MTKSPDRFMAISVRICCDTCRWWKDKCGTHGICNHEHFYSSRWCNPLADGIVGRDSVYMLFGQDFCCKYWEEEKGEEDVS